MRKGKRNHSYIWQQLTVIEKTLKKDSLRSLWAQKMKKKWPSRCNYIQKILKDLFLKVNLSLQPKNDHFKVIHTCIQSNNFIKVKMNTIPFRFNHIWKIRRMKTTLKIYFTCFFLCFRAFLFIFIFMISLEKWIKEATSFTQICKQSKIHIRIKNLHSKYLNSFNIPTKTHILWQLASSLLWKNIHNAFYIQVWSGKLVL